MSKWIYSKFLHALDREYRKGNLKFFGSAAVLEDKQAFKKLKDKLYRKKWVTYAKRPFGGAEHVFEYLGRYTHRVAISNQRLIKMDEREVTFYTKNMNEARRPNQLKRPIIA